MLLTQIELGLGVVLGGILRNAAPTFVDDDVSVITKKSVTLTDANNDVLDMLQQNIKHVAACNNGMHV